MLNENDSNTSGAREEHASLRSRLLLMAGSVIFILVVLEVVLRVAAPHDNIPQIEYDEHLGWRGRADISCRFRKPQYAIDVSQNSAGFRDRDRSISKESGTFRVLCTGDSFTWGAGVEQDEIYTAVLESLLEDSGLRAEVINSGVGGYSTDQILLYLAGDGFRYEPDLVVYQACDNDLQGILTKKATGVYSKPSFEFDERGQLELTGYPVPALAVPERLFVFMTRSSRLAFFLRHRLQVFRLRRWEQGTGSAPGDAGVGAERDELHALRLFCALVRELERECHTRGVRFVVTLDFPLTSDQADLWQQECEGIETVYLFEHFQERQADAGGVVLIPGDGHWTALAHRWVAEHLAATILEPSTESPG